MLQGIEECGCVWRDARAPGATSTATEGQGDNDDCEAIMCSTQKVYSAPICKRRGSLTTQFGVVPPKVQPKF